MTRLSGKVALVTGATSGIGKAAALAFAREGARVVMAGRRAEAGEELRAQIEQAGGQALFVQTDVSQAGQVENLVNRAVERFGRLDCAFNNAATITNFSFTADISEEEFDHEINLNLKSVWLCLKYEIQQMLNQASPGGAIVNTSSVNGLGGTPGASLYSVSKSGILALTKSAALEYATKNIRVNALVAGAFNTPMLQGVITSFADRANLEQSAVENFYNERIPQGRIGRPGEAADVAVWLCSDEAGYVTGHSMIVDGGMSAAYR
ncbi:MAG: glucose 1-dehydrogenase [Chloroflexi bacterium]|nr:glucose 1-dehydrogenase [Chloroflexota bacterium]OJW02039.1 MAG: short chain dehydrogenase [Chloroflexi bacterium 54-19]